MRKNILKEYFAMYKKYGVGRYKDKNVASVIYGAAALVGALSVNLSSRACDFVLGLLVILPLFTAIITMGFHPIKLEKMMYLCPIDTEERKNNVQQLFLVRIKIYMVLTVLLVIISYIVGKGRIAQSLLMLIENTMIASIVVPSTDYDATKSNERKQLIHTVLILTALIVSALIMFAEGSMIAYILSGLIVVLIQLPIVSKHVKYIKEEMNEAIYYESEGER